MSDDAANFRQRDAGETAALRRADGADLVGAALDHLRGGLPSDGAAYGTPSLARQKEVLREWARSLGLLLSPDRIVPRLERGDQAHDWFGERDTLTAMQSLATTLHQEDV